MWGNTLNLISITSQRAQINFTWARVQVCVTAWRQFIVGRRRVCQSGWVWSIEEIIKFKRSIKMSGFYQVRWEEEWLRGLRGQVNYSEVDCPGLFDAALGARCCIVPSCHNCLSLFHSCFVNVYRRWTKKTGRAIGFHLFVYLLFTHAESQISSVFNVLRDIDLYERWCYFCPGLIFFTFRRESKKN